jgi:hypothetical protein
MGTRRPPDKLLGAFRAVFATALLSAVLMCVLV